MKKISLKIIVIIIASLSMVIGGCNKKFEKYPANPNLPNENDNIPPDMILRKVLNDIHLGGGVSAGRSGNVPEQVFQLVSRMNQYTVGMRSPLYGGSNEYDWAHSASPYSTIRDLNQMERQAINAYGEANNPYLTMSKFVKAYFYIWFTQRVGDIPMSEAGLGLDTPTPKFDKQKDVYSQCLDLLEEVNEEFAQLQASSVTSVQGDIYFNGNLSHWQKATNALLIRTLISLSKRADDTPELRIKQRFAEAIGNPAKYPLFTSNNDNLAFEWVPVVNRPDIFWRGLYADQTVLGKPIVDVTTQKNDPRIFLFGTPAPDELNAGKTVDDFTAYVGAPSGTPQGILGENSKIGDPDDGYYSYVNFVRYFGDRVDNYLEDKTIIGFAELCFNIAEGIERGWAAGNAADFYNQGIQASLDFFGITDGMTLEIAGAFGAPKGSVVVDLPAFLNHPDVVYQGGQTGIRQIIEQKYVALWENGNWEPFYNYRRTGYPEFDYGQGTNNQGQIPVRWRYEPAEIQNNPNASKAISEQFGSDNVFSDMWLTKD